MSFFESAQALAFVLLVTFLAYVAILLVPFLTRKQDPEGDPTLFDWHFFIPCRDEEVVIKNTVRSLVTQFPGAHIWVIDDDSEDSTAEVVVAMSRENSKIHLIQRRRPNARTGKGDALNAAYAALNAWLPATTDRTRCIVAVVDGDGELAPNALAQASGSLAFGDPTVGAAQAAVWMRNRNDPNPASGNSRLKQAMARYLVRMQDIEFRTTIAAMQSLRRHTLSVGLGGNGQFTRLSALDAVADIAKRPWHGGLLEDYELAIHIMLAGHHTVYMHDTHVSQEALPSVRRLLTQRTRWCQGGMQCSRYLKNIFVSPHFTNLGALESSYFLLIPYVQLIGLFLWPTLFLSMIGSGAVTAGSVALWLSQAWWLIPLILLTGVVPFALWGPIYRRQAEPGRNFFMGLVWGVGYWLYMYQSYVCVLRAGFRMLTGRNGWAKTRRNNESDAQLLAKEA
ncbi:glycosyltransferase family 2 protein [Arthrobacter alpinus]|uniref:glycosyltransferase family 2 protein n=1 Tax=Arthrobacter alpinus TaxID=656366 RepID=UPI0009F1C4A2|nr:glycosyltransferase family 2 protein [Arthrobacter alpinus]